MLCDTENEIVKVQCKLVSYHDFSAIKNNQNCFLTFSFSSVMADKNRPVFYGTFLFYVSSLRYLSKSRMYYFLKQKKILFYYKMLYFCGSNEF